MPWRTRLKRLFEERPEPRAVEIGVLVLALLLLGGMSLADPELRFVDFLAFSSRAEGLRQGLGLSHPLYPVGYPALLSLLQWLLGDVLLAGRLISVAAGVGACWAASRLLGPWVALWLLVQFQVLLWGTAAGTDLLATGLALGALAAAHHERAWLAGALAGAACMTRYTGLAVLPVVLVVSGWRPLVSWALVVAPHFALAALGGGHFLPDQSSNMAIGHGGPPGEDPGLVIGYLTGLWRALPQAFGDPPTWLGAAGLLVGMIRRDRRAWMLFAYAALHMAGLALAFANPRLALPASACMALGLFWLVPRRWALLPALALGLWSVPRSLEAPPDAIHSRPMVAAAQDHPGLYLSTSPWFYTRRDGWLVEALPVWALAEPHQLRPSHLKDWAEQHGGAYLMYDQIRARRAQGLRPLSGAELPEGFEMVAHDKGWRIFWIEP